MSSSPSPLLTGLLRELNEASRSEVLLTDMGRSANELVALNEVLRGKLENEKHTTAELRLACCNYETNAKQLQGQLNEYEARHNADRSKALLMDDRLALLRSENTQLEDIVARISAVITDYRGV